MKWFARGAVAIVWLYNGLWCKLLEPCPSTSTSWPRSPLLGSGGARPLVRGIGAGETLLALWVLSGRSPRAAAVVQTGLLVAMNAGGLLWGRRWIPDPAALAVQNLAFLALVWSLAVWTRDDRKRSV